MRFTSDVPCFMKFKEGGMFYGHGLCAMEVATIMMGGSLFSGASFNGVNEYLTSLVIQTNDLDCPEVSDEERADALWPLLPKIFDTGRIGTSYPVGRLCEKLGISPRHPNHPAPVAAYARITDEERGTYWDFGRGIKALQIGIETFWEEMNRTPQDDFTEQQITNLITWMTTQQDVDPTSYLRNDAVLDEL